MNTQELPHVTADFLLASTSPEMREQMFVACACANDIAGLDKLMVADDTVLARAGDNALAGACAKGYLAVVQHLHAHGVRLDSAMVWPVDVDATTAQFPLHEALSNQQWDIARWLLENGASMRDIAVPLRQLLNAAPDLFAQMVQAIPYIAAFKKLKPDTAGEERRHGDELKYVLEQIAIHDHVAEARILLEQGLPAKMLYHEMMGWHAYDAIRMLYDGGYRPDVFDLDLHYYLIQEETVHVEKAKKMKALVDDITYADHHITLGEDELVHLRSKLGIHDQRAAAAIALTRGGDFINSVAPLMITVGAELLKVQDIRSFTLERILHLRGELPLILSPVVWRGDSKAALAFYHTLDQQTQAELDISAISASFTTYHLPPGRGRFKLGFAHGGTP